MCVLNLCWFLCLYKIYTNRTCIQGIQIQMFRSDMVDWVFKTNCLWNGTGSWQTFFVCFLSIGISQIIFIRKLLLDIFEWLICVTLAGWSCARDDSNSNSGSNLYPVMLHQNPAAYSNPVFPGFSGPNTSGSPSAVNPYANPMPGSSQDISGLDPSGGCPFFHLWCFCCCCKLHSLRGCWALGAWIVCDKKKAEENLDWKLFWFTVCSWLLQSRLYTRCD